MQERDVSDCLSMPGPTEEENGRKAGQRHRQLEEEGIDWLEPALPQRGREIVRLTGMVHPVGCPQEAHFVRGAMVEVIGEVDADHCCHEPDGGQLLPLARRVAVHPAVRENLPGRRPV